MRLRRIPAPPNPPAVPCFRVALMLPPDARSAGRIPTATPVITERAAVQANTCQSGERSSDTPTAPFAIFWTSSTAFVPSHLQAQSERNSPAVPPSTPSTRLSAQNCLTNLPRLAPSASLKATSCARPEFRAAIRFVRFTQPIRRTSPTATIRITQTAAKPSNAPPSVWKNVALTASN